MGRSRLGADPRGGRGAGDGRRKWPRDRASQPLDDRRICPAALAGSGSGNGQALELSGGMQMRGSGTKAIQRWAAAALLVLTALPAAAQTTAGGVTGSVHDEQGAAITGATATLTSDTRGTVLTAAMNRSGDFVFATVPPDTYTLSVKADGFKSVERRNVV